MDIQIGTQVKITNPDDTSEYGVVIGDEGVVVWVGEFRAVFGVCIPKKGDVWSFESSQLEITSNFAVPEGFVLVEKSKINTAIDALVLACDIRESDSNYEDALNHFHQVAQSLDKAQEPSHD